MSVTGLPGGVRTIRRAAVAIAVIVVGYFVLTALRSPRFVGSEPLAIELSFLSPSRGASDSPVLQARITSPRDCQSVFKLLRKAQSQGEHKCASIGSMILQYAGGTTDELSFLPGHNPSRYEFRYDGTLYHVSRARLFEALRDAGVDTTKIPQTEH